MLPVDLPFKVCYEKLLREKENDIVRNSYLYKEKKFPVKIKTSICSIKKKFKKKKEWS